MLITDSRRQFIGARFVKFYKEHVISHHLTFVVHLQVNREVEVTNHTLFQGLKKRLGKAKGLWANELYHVPWTYRTTPRVLKEEIPFNLAFETEVVVLVELGVLSVRVKNFDE